MRHLGIVLVVVLAGVSCSSTPSAPSDKPLSGTFHGSSFQFVGGRTTNVDSTVDIELVNAAADCSMAVIPADGQIEADISMPQSMLAPGTYTLGSAVTFGITKVMQTKGAPLSFDAFGGGDGTVVIKSVGGGFIEGSVSVTADRLSLDGTFKVPFCAVASDAGADGPSDGAVDGGG